MLGEPRAPPRVCKGEDCLLFPLHTQPPKPLPALAALHQTSLGLACPQGRGGLYLCIPFRRHEVWCRSAQAAGDDVWDVGSGGCPSPGSRGTCASRRGQLPAERSRGETLLLGQMLTPRENAVAATVLAKNRSTKRLPSAPVLLFASPGCEEQMLEPLSLAGAKNLS